nr:MAG TPA: hypothetical protein [Caudoviricetes sp.]
MNWLKMFGKSRNKLNLLYEFILTQERVSKCAKRATSRVPYDAGKRCRTGCYA